MSLRLALARLPISRWVIGFIFAYMSFMIPVKRLYESKTLLAFHHPQAAYPLHILIVPKRNRGSFLDLNETDHDFLLDLVTAVQTLVHKFKLETNGYRLVSNGGAYQDVPHLHFHLISEDYPN